MDVELDYWTSRKRVEIEMATCAASPEVRLAHEQLARRYGDRAFQAETASLVGLVMAQAAADYVVNDPHYTTIGDAIAVALRSRAA